MTLVISNNCTFQKNMTKHVNKSKRETSLKKIFATSKAIWKVVLQDSFGVWCWFYPQPRKKTPSHHGLPIFELRNTNSSLREHYTRSLGRSFFFFRFARSFFLHRSIAFCNFFEHFCRFCCLFFVYSGRHVENSLLFGVKPNFFSLFPGDYEVKGPPLWHFPTTEKAPFFQRGAFIEVLQWQPALFFKKLSPRWLWKMWC